MTTCGTVAVVNILPDGANSVVNMDIIEDVLGDTTIHNIFSNQPVTGLDLANLAGYRVIAGGRTGGAFNDGSIDNIAVVSIPEPATAALLCLATLLGALGHRRMKGI